MGYGHSSTPSFSAMTGHLDVYSALEKTQSVSCRVGIERAGRARFQLEGSGIATMNQSVQKSAHIQLRAFLTPDDAGEGTTSNVAQGERFAVSATFSAASLVCYNDTIFRDGFDGTGL
jgi:hypothetical protein